MSVSKQRVYPVKRSPMASLAARLGGPLVAAGLCSGTLAACTNSQPAADLGGTGAPLSKAEYMMAKVKAETKCWETGMKLAQSVTRTTTVYCDTNVGIETAVVEPKGNVIVYGPGEYRPYNQGQSASPLDIYDIMAKPQRNSGPRV